MARLTKPQLLALVETAFRSSGWQVLNRGGIHPALLTLFRDDVRLRTRIYIWNITPGGNNRPLNERRIQITPATPFLVDSDEKTLVLGWDAENQVFAGWDVRQHTDPLGSSPSFQITLETLEKATASVFAPYVKASGETAIAFRPSFFPIYVQFLEELHISGSLQGEKDLLDELIDDPSSVSDSEIEMAVAPERQFAVVTTRKAVRAIDFRDRVLGAYTHACAMCGVQLRLVDGAHILPVAHPESTDQTANGVALCALHHRAYDRGLVTFDGKYNIRVRPLDDLKTAGKARGYKEFKANLFKLLELPSNIAERPAKAFIAKANELRGWTGA